MVWFFAAEFDYNVARSAIVVSKTPKTLRGHNFQPQTPCKAQPFKGLGHEA